jgi:hypothetical protein
VEALKQKGLITDDISQGSSKYMGVCKLVRRGLCASNVDSTLMPNARLNSPTMKMKRKRRRR